MLNKELLRYRLRSGKLKPLFIDGADTQIQSFIELTLNTYRDSLHSRREEVEHELELAQQSAGLDTKLANGILKIIEKSADYESFKHEEFRNARLDYFRTVSRLRRNQNETPQGELQSRLHEPESAHLRFAISAFESQIQRLAIQELNESFRSLLQTNLYADLPSQDKLIGLPSLSPEQIVDRYNIALVQGLLLNSKNIVLQVIDSSLTNRRRLFSYMKFFGVTAKRVALESNSEKAGICLELEGPLSVLESSKSYGFQLSCFFPAILQLEKWSLEMNVSFTRDQRVFSLMLDESYGLVPYFEKKLSYRPEEISSFKESFNALQCGWNLEDCAELIQLENGDHCFPDFVFTKIEKPMPKTKKNSKPLSVYLEVFFAWNKSILLNRLRAPKRFVAADSQQSALVLAFEKKMLKIPEVIKALDSSENSAEGSGSLSNHLTFSQFLSPKAVSKVLAEL